MKQDLFTCEADFYHCFASLQEENGRIRFRNSVMPDRYDNNMSMFSMHGYSEQILEETIQQELQQSKNDGLLFGKLLIDGIVPQTVLSALPSCAQIDFLGVYQLDLARIETWKGNPDCSIVRATEKKHIDDLLELELDEYKASRGEDFCTRCNAYFGDVYFRSEKVDAYLAYMQNELAGKCQLFINDTIAKIENLDVKASFRNQRIATTLLKQTATIALQHGADTIFLIAYEDDTPKEMYQKMGFERVGVWTDIFVPFDDENMSGFGETQKNLC